MSDGERRSERLVEVGKDKAKQKQKEAKQKQKEVNDKKENKLMKNAKQKFLADPRKPSQVKEGSGR